jgi:hypothetical protein
MRIRNHDVNWLLILLAELSTSLHNWLGLAWLSYNGSVFDNWSKVGPKNHWALPPSHTGHQTPLPPPPSYATMQRDMGTEQEIVKNNNLNPN